MSRVASTFPCCNNMKQGPNCQASSNMRTKESSSTCVTPLDLLWHARKSYVAKVLRWEPERMLGSLYHNRIQVEVLGLLVRRVRIPSCNVESLLLLRNENGARKAFPYSVQLSVLGTTNHEPARDVRLHSKFKFENSAGRCGTSFAMSSSWREPGTPPPMR